MGEASTSKDGPTSEVVEYGQTSRPYHRNGIEICGFVHTLVVEKYHDRWGHTQRRVPNIVVGADPFIGICTLVLYTMKIDLMKAKD